MYFLSLIEHSFRTILALFQVSVKLGEVQYDPAIRDPAILAFVVIKVILLLYRLLLKWETQFQNDLGLKKEQGSS
ncbi:MAG: hypothetical protein DRR42_07805 [Gammaproteobacteria bacterium]|nr:MAG: hypothetical protein DRR42_07805 [Gammaproteobacteria bacterium]